MTLDLGESVDPLGWRTASPMPITGNMSASLGEIDRQLRQVIECP
jgi:hypothetical protein